MNVTSINIEVSYEKPAEDDKKQRQKQLKDIWADQTFIYILYICRFGSGKT